MLISYGLSSNNARWGVFDVLFIVLLGMRNSDPIFHMIHHCSQKVIQHIPSFLGGPTTPGMLCKRGFAINTLPTRFFLFASREFSHVEVFESGIDGDISPSALECRPFLDRGDAEGSSRYPRSTVSSTVIYIDNLGINHRESPTGFL